MMSRSECSEHGQRLQGCPMHILRLNKVVSKKKTFPLHEKEIIAHNKIYRYVRGVWRCLTMLFIALSRIYCRWCLYQNEYEKKVEYQNTNKEKTRLRTGKPVSNPFGLPKIQYLLAWDRNQFSSLRGQRMVLRKCGLNIWYRRKRRTVCDRGLLLGLFNNDSSAVDIVVKIAKDSVTSTAQKLLKTWSQIVQTQKTTNF